ncbi:MAG: aspartate aminotransferase family protein [Burkholderiales bacterium]|nr:aspartate aminotransferase family protein [Burkholderiales bacterium]
MTADFAKPTSRIFHRAPGHDYPVAVRGAGIHLFDAAGRRTIDACGGAAVSCLGHGHARVVEAIRRQAERLAYVHTSFFTTEPAEALAAHLVAHAPPGISHATFVSGGGEAMETALKMARQYFLEIGQPRRTRFIARRQSYHGNTLGALAIGGNRWRRAPYAPLLMPATHVSPCYPYREQAAGESADAYGARLARELDDAITAAGPETVIAFVAEPVVGATLGAAPAVPGYFRRVREVCDRHGVLLILDEVMCGMGRCGTRYACEAEGVAPDLITIAKGLGAGYQPIGAVLVGRRVHDAFAAGSGAFQHGYTYMGHAIACAAALEVQRVIDDDDLLAAVRARGADLEAGLRRAFGAHPHVGDIRGRGLMWAIELVAERADARPFDPALQVHARVKRAAMERGLACYPSGGCVDGQRGDHVLLAPPFIASREDIGEIVDILARAVDAAIAGLPAG